MPRYRNIGDAPWRRTSGEMVPHGGTFEATEREHARILRRPSYRQRVQLVDPLPVAATTPTPGWPLKMAPEMYLRMHPDGQHAALAQEIVNAQGEEAPE